MADFIASFSKPSDKLQNILHKVYAGALLKTHTDHTHTEFTTEGRLFSHGGQKQSEGQQ